MDNSSPSMLKPTLIGGLALGVAGGLPLVGALNCACCSLIMGAGFLAAFLYSKECKKVGAGFRPGNGAMVGLVAGLFYAVAQTAVGAIFKPDPEELNEQIDMMVEQMESGGAPPEFVDFFTRMIEMFGAGSGAAILMGFLVTLLLAAVFATIGGLIGGSVFKVEAQPPAAPSPPAGSGTES